MKYGIFSILIFLFINSCNVKLTEPNQTDDSSGSVLMKLNMIDAPSDVVRIAGKLSRENQDTVFFDLTISDNYASGLVEDLINGNWNLQLDAYNAENYIIYTGSSLVTIIPGQIIPVNLHLNPTTGSLEINVTWGDSEEYFLDFDGIDDYVQVPNNKHLNFLSSFTLEAWIYPNDISTDPLGGGRTIIRKGNVYHNRNFTMEINVFRGPGQLQFGFTGSGVGSKENVVSVNQWQHVAGVCDMNSELLKLYVNGELIEQRAIATVPQISNDPVVIGATFRGDSLGVEDFFDGLIKDVRIWNIARTQAEIKENMHTQLDGTETGLTANWKINEGAGQIIHDTANNYNGFLGEQKETDDSDPNWIANPY